MSYEQNVYMDRYQDYPSSRVYTVLKVQDVASTKVVQVRIPPAVVKELLTIGIKYNNPSTRKE